MAYDVQLTTDSQEEWDQIDAYFAHQQNCTECNPDPRILGMTQDAVNKVVDIQLVDGAVDWSTPTH